MTALLPAPPRLPAVPRPPAGWSPPAHLTPLGPASFALPEGWLLGVLPSGLVLRHPGAAVDAVVHRPPAPGVLEVHVLPDGGAVPYDVLVEAARLCRSLPRDGYEIRLLVPDGTDTTAVADLGAALRLPVLRRGAAPLSPAYAPGDEGRVARRRRGLVTARLDVVESGAADPAAVVLPPPRAWRTRDPDDDTWRPGIRRRPAP